jgi:trehalose 6-phosphate synthase/phosphatase
MDPILRKKDGIWIGWAGTSEGSDDEERKSVLKDWAQKEQCFAVDLPQEIATGFYEGYSNQTLWPVFHNFPSQLKFDANDWQAYVEANRIFAKAAVEHYRPNDVVWVHDYQLMLLPKMLRDELPDAAIGVSFTSPFPRLKSFQSCHDGRTFFRGCWELISWRSRRMATCSNSAPHCSVCWALRAE